MAKEFIEIVEANFRLIHMAYERQALELLADFINKQPNSDAADSFNKGFESGWNACVEDINVDVPDNIDIKSMTKSQQSVLDAARRDYGIE